MLWKKELVFLVVQNQVFQDDNEKDLKNQVFSYVNESTKTLFGSKKIQYTDFYNSKNDMGVYTLLATCKPENKNKLFLALLYEIYAFTLTNDKEIFSSYEYEEKEWGNEQQKIKVYKFKI